MQEDFAMRASYEKALNHLESLSSFRRFRAGNGNMSEDAIATQTAKYRDGPATDPSLQCQTSQPPGNAAPSWTSTQVFQQGCLPQESSDVWAAAQVAYELLVGEAPLQKLEGGTHRPSGSGSLPGFLNFLSEDCADFLQFALNTDAADRPTAHQCLDHPWLQYYLSRQVSGYSSDSSHDADDSLLFSRETSSDSQPPHSAACSWKIKTRETGSWSSDASSMSDGECEPFTFWPLGQRSLQDGADDIYPRSLPVTSKRFRQRQQSSKSGANAFCDAHFSTAHPFGWL